MKTLKWFWWAALIAICFKAINAVIGAANGTYSFDAESFVGMVSVFALISGVLIVFWIMGRAKEALSGKTAKRKDSEQ